MSRLDHWEATPGRGASTPIRIAILGDHTGIIDGYHYRLDKEPDITVVADTSYGEDLERLLVDNAVDLLIQAKLMIDASPGGGTRTRLSWERRNRA